MHWIELSIWIGLATIGLVGAGLGAGLETGVYTMNRVRLHVLQHQGIPSAVRLARLFATPSALIASLLIGHNACVKLATHAAAVMLDSRDLSQWVVVVVDALIMIPLLFAFADTVPKDLFAIHADRLLYLFSRPMAALVILCRFSGLLLLITGASQILMRLLGVHRLDATFHPRRQVQTLVREGVGLGLLSDEQMAIVERVLALGERTVEQVMKPWPQVITVHLKAPPTVLWTLASKTGRTRFPVIDDVGDVVGLVHLHDALVAGRDQCPPIAVLMASPETLLHTTALHDALAELQQRRCETAILIDETRRPVGIVTIKDLIEPITGQLAEL